MSATDILKPFGDIARSIFPSGNKNTLSVKVNELIQSSPYISRDLSWLQFNYRVLDQAKKTSRSLSEKLKFLAITASNFDEFFMIRVGSLYNYIDFGKERIDYSGLRETQFRLALFQEAHTFFKAQYALFQDLESDFIANDCKITKIEDLTDSERETVFQYFKKTVFPMLTPMLLDPYHAFPVVNNKALTFGIVTQNPEDSKNPLRLSLLQIPQNLSRFFEIERSNLQLFLPLEEIIRWQMDKLFKNVEIVSANLFRITRNGDISIEESDDIESDFIDEVRRKLNNRRTGRVVRIEIEDNYSSFMMKVLKARWEIDYDNIFICPNLIDFTCVWQIIKHPDFKELIPFQHSPVPPVSYPKSLDRVDMFEVLKQKDILLHHPYNNMEPLLLLLEQAAEDPGVLSIKMTIYRLAKDSRIINALLKAAENGKYVSVLFEVKARFDEENNIREAKKLQKAGCFVIYGVGSLKTHTKLLQIVRKEDDKVTRFIHLGSGNYNEITSKLYSDISLLTTNETYANDVSEFFNVITGHSVPDSYNYLITAPRDMRTQLVALIKQEAANAKAGLTSGIMIKINSLEDKSCIDALYEASKAGVSIKLIIRGMCCLRPQRKNLSENIQVRSLVGDYLEHTRIYYFHNNGDPKVYGGSADMMNRSFDRRIESLFLIHDHMLMQECIHILQMNWSDNTNAYQMQENGDYQALVALEGEKIVNIHEEFYRVKLNEVEKAHVF
jgi:polyphosphate kinase